MYLILFQSVTLIYSLFVVCLFVFTYLCFYIFMWCHRGFPDVTVTTCTKTHWGRFLSFFPSYKHILGPTTKLYVLSQKTLLRQVVAPPSETTLMLSLFKCVQGQRTNNLVYSCKYKDTHSDFRKFIHFWQVISNHVILHKNKSEKRHSTAFLYNLSAVRL